ncbi:hypothetical protein DB032_19560 [Chromobacterium sp. Panama]|uniref:antiviral RADAR system adenosine deaminase RdrB n=1 Tax=Chromobacterium sp. Panama TaxID=2161826 RepID=UPI000D315777|nr:antiviral RADAR system adenosine deaminase RdrB [Chromobacterium sp. Panama]PTU66962.1 hypothetical protein DB032_19560 [Chromobacterium sp. Panama]
MLLRAVPERALGALLGGEPVADVLCQYLIGLTRPTKPEGVASKPSLEPLRKALRAAIQADIDQRTARYHRLNELQTMAQQLCAPRFLETTEIPALAAAFDEVMEWRGSQVCFKDKHVQRYAELISELDPTVLVAWQLANDRGSPQIESPATLKEAVEGLATLFVGPRFFTQPFAENHAHLHGIAGDDLVLAQLVLSHGFPVRNEDDEESSETGEAKADVGKADLDERDPPPEPPHVIRLRRIRRLLEAFIGVWKTVNADEPSTLTRHEEALIHACPHDVKSAVGSSTLNWREEDRGIVVGDEVINTRWMLKQLAGAASRGDLQYAWTWLFVLLWRTYRAQAASATIRVAVLLLITDVMALRRQLIMDGNGLRRFTTSYFRPVMRLMAGENAAWKGMSQKETARRVFARLGDRAELKISAGSFLEAAFTAAFAQVADGRIESLRSLHPDGDVSYADLSSLDHWHFCLHFNRSGSKTRHARRKSLWEEARKLKGVLGSSVKWDLEPLLRGGSSTLGGQFTPARFVRGLDVAGDETRWPIEVFAPMLRWLRYQEVVTEPLEESTVPATVPHFSIHAGEDYAHPLSGLRHIDETVLFCEMKEGDRLGHALALGIPPDGWLRRHGEVLLPVDEHVDNLVWAWHQASELARTKQLAEAERVLPRLATRITRFLPHVSWRPASSKSSLPPLSELHEAWKLRRNCSYLVLEQPKSVPTGGSTLDIGAPDLQVISAQVGKPSVDVAAGLYVHRARAERDLGPQGKGGNVMVRLTQQRHGHASRAQLHLETLGPDRAFQMHDHDDVHDLRFMLALQDACIERYAQAGISIEANPSSNVYIGQIETHSDHPVYRWYPPDPKDLLKGGKFNEFDLRTMPMPVTINTDDQGIVPTTLRMEHHLMHEAALDRGHAETLADAWIEELRSLGLQHFETTHQLERNAP